MTMYGDQQNEPPTELELEEQRAGVDLGADRVTDDVAWPLWVAGLVPRSGDYGRLSPPGGDAGPATRDRIAVHTASPVAPHLCAPAACRRCGACRTGDRVEETWRITGPLLDKSPKVHSYKPDTWGPKEADKLTADVGGWRESWVES